MLTRKTLLLNDCELKYSAIDSSGEFSGYASSFGGVDSYNDTILPGAYKGVIERIQAGAARMPKMFVNHRSWEMPVGKWLEMSEDDTGLMVRGEFTSGNPQAAVVKAALKHETIDGLSIGYRLSEDGYEMVQKDGAEIRVIKSIAELAEISIVTFPADDSARVDLTSVKSALDNIQNIKDLEDFLREAGGFSKALATATASRCKRLFTRSESEELQLPDELRAAIAANLQKARTL